MAMRPEGERAWESHGKHAPRSVTSDDVEVKALGRVDGLYSKHIRSPSTINVAFSNTKHLRVVVRDSLLSAIMTDTLPSENRSI